jgi:hypothetical protein
MVRGGRCRHQKITADLRSGSENAATTACIPDLRDEEIEQLYDIIAVPHGHELIVTDDGIAECFGGFLLQIVQDLNFFNSCLFLSQSASSII